MRISPGSEQGDLEIRDRSGKEPFENSMEGRSTSFAAQAARISDQRRQNDMNYLMAQLNSGGDCDIDMLACAQRDCSLVRYLNDVHLQAELDELMRVAAAPDAPHDAPELPVPDESSAAVGATATANSPTLGRPLPESPKWLGAWASDSNGFCHILDRIPTLRKVLAGIPRLSTFGPEFGPPPRAGCACLRPIPPRQVLVRRENSFLDSHVAGWLRQVAR